MPPFLRGIQDTDNHEYHTDRVSITVPEGTERLLIQIVGHKLGLISRSAVSQQVYGFHLLQRRNDGQRHINLDDRLHQRKRDPQKRLTVVRPVNGCGLIKSRVNILDSGIID